jgi:hypothetical protein
VNGKGSLKRKIHRAAKYFDNSEMKRFIAIKELIPSEENYTYKSGQISIDEFSFRIWTPQQIAVVLYHELLHFERYRDGRRQIEAEVEAESDGWARDKGLRLPNELTSRQETLADWLMQIR